MHAWEQIQQTVEYIEEHLDQDISIDELAKIANLSPFYYQRLFTRLVKKPVMEYIKLRRMAIATESLLQNDKRILDIALDLGFSSHEQFSRTFKDVFGITPDNYRKSPTTLNKMTKPQLLLNYTLIDENVPLVTDGIVLEISRKRLESTEHFVGLVANVPVSWSEGLGIESGNDPLYSIWETFHNNKLSIQSLMQNGDEIGAAYPCSEEGYFCYFAGGQANSNEPVKGYKNWELVSGEYIVCSFEAENFDGLVLDALYKAQKYMFDVWIPNHKELFDISKSNRELTTHPFSVERYASHNPNTRMMELWILPISEAEK